MLHTGKKTNTRHRDCHRGLRKTALALATRKPLGTSVGTAADSRRPEEETGGNEEVKVMGTIPSLEERGKSDDG